MAVEVIIGKGSVLVVFMSDVNCEVPSVEVVRAGGISVVRMVWVDGNIEVITGITGVVDVAVIDGDPGVRMAEENGIKVDETKGGRTTEETNGGPVRIEVANVVEAGKVSVSSEGTDTLELTEPEVPKDENIAVVESWLGSKEVLSEGAEFSVTGGVKLDPCGMVVETTTMLGVIEGGAGRVVDGGASPMEEVALSELAAVVIDTIPGNELGPPDIWGVGVVSVAEKELSLGASEFVELSTASEDELGPIEFKLVELLRAVERLGLDVSEDIKLLSVAENVCLPEGV